MLVQKCKGCNPWDMGREECRGGVEEEDDPSDGCILPQLSASNGDVGCMCCSRPAAQCGVRTGEGVVFVIDPPHETIYATVLRRKL